MRGLRTAVWAGVALLSGAMSLAAWRSPTGYPAPEPPPALPRATEADRALLEARRLELLRALESLSDAQRDSLDDEALSEALAAPDNPLVPGRGGLARACPPEQAPPMAEWGWCPQTGALAAMGLQ